VQVFLGGLLSGCLSQPVGPSVEPSDSEVSTSPDMTACVNEEDGYAVSYPSGWHTNPVTETYAPCSYFDPAEVTLAQLDASADRLRPDPHERPAISLAVLGGGQGYASGGEQTSFEEIEVAGQPATRFEEVAVPGSIMAPGERAYVVRVSFGAGSLIARTPSSAASNAEEYDDQKAVLDTIVSTLQFGDP